jgi:hypothetical protein
MLDVALHRQLFAQPLGELDEHAPVRHILDLVESNNQPQTFDDVEIDLIFAKQPQQFVTGQIGIVRAHKKAPARKMATREDDLRGLANDLKAAIEKARTLNLPTSAYIPSMALVEVSQALKISANSRRQ